MASTPIQFNDGVAYERMMGRWSRLAGERFLDWLGLPPGLRLLDVGCGNGAFTDLLIERCAPSAVQGIDPSEGQIDFARKRAGMEVATFRQGDAQALPYAHDDFDAATMALVINLIPDQPKAIAEMVRVVRPGGPVATYIWDFTGGGFTMEPIRRVLGEMGVPSPFFGADASSMDSLQFLWEGAGLADVELKRIDITLDYESFDDFWDGNTAAPNTVVNAMQSLSPSDIENVRERLRKTLPTGPDGRISYGAYANAVKGTVR